MHKVFKDNVCTKGIGGEYRRLKRALDLYPAGNPEHLVSILANLADEQRYLPLSEVYGRLPDLPSEDIIDALRALEKAVLVLSDKSSHTPQYKITEDGKREFADMASHITREFADMASHITR